ncbi:uncharacterized protein CTHT_0064010 [Thermochaetoides thermophila DSM 1495]|uniref:Uncharacterized protein n=1 Tax=Chaetomium thermophilum (strain DSM 1495 / CBS 144.50 / IMI 039719) TaxID=759272 RepID=G0SEJ9_CHATD|nr:hypothetical protein CTHT_0064010 [Thermochaetoides thermophila DSM 1495]EGS18376.1 hypothetical protein CTHT_0064010 [Thermochaetoides thermophila DSM 1495]
MSFQGHSNVGFPSLYESSNQKNTRQEEVEELTRRSGENVKAFLNKSQMDEVNRLREKEIEKKRQERLQKDPTFAATLHGNKPHKGAIIDKELQEEDEAILRRKAESQAMKKERRMSTGRRQ